MLKSQALDEKQEGISNLYYWKQCSNLSVDMNFYHSTWSRRPINASFRVIINSNINERNVEDGEKEREGI